MNKIEFLPEEEWVTLQLDERRGKTKYAVSNFGRVISYSKELANGKLLPLNLEPTRHTRIKIEFKTGSKSFYIHKIVAEHFVPKSSDEFEDVIHLNKDIKDNHYKNLAWASHTTYKQTILEANYLRKKRTASTSKTKQDVGLKLYVGEECRDIDAGITNKKYAITNYGRLISYYDKIENGAFLKVGTHAQGYKIWHYKTEGKAKAYLLHRLVAIYFLQPPSEKHIYVIHKDHNKANNVVSNLAWATFDEQLKHADTSLAVIERKEYHKHRSEITGRGAKLTVGKVRLLKKILFDSNRTTRMKMIAKQFGISTMQLYRIKSGENWAWVQHETANK